MGKSTSIGTDVDAHEIFGPINETGSPERNLLMAILVRAILDYVGNDRKEAMSAEEWLAMDSSVDCEEPYTFQWICDQLDLDHLSIRERIFSMPKRGEHRVAPWYFMREEHISKVLVKKNARRTERQNVYRSGSAHREERMVAYPS